MNFSFELNGDRGAALVTRYPTYCEDSLLDSAFEEYTVRHYESWVAFARYKQYGNNVHPVLVSGVDMTRDFAMVAYSNKSTFQEPGQTVAIPMFASAAGSFRGMWRARCLTHTNHGPQQSSPPPHQLAMYAPFPFQPGDEGGTTSGFIQCVFVRYYTMRSKGPLALFPKVIRASGGPHDLGPGDNSGNTFPELLVQSGAEPATTSYGGLGGEWDLTEDETEPEPDIVVQNTSYVWHFPYPFASTLNFTLRMRNTITGMLLQIMYSRYHPCLYFHYTSHLNLFEEELQCYICIDAPSRSDGDLCSRPSIDIELQSLIFG